MSAYNFPNFTLSISTTPYTSQSMQHPALPTGKCMPTGKMNSIDNQRVTPNNPKITGNKPEIKNKPYMTRYDHKIPATQQKKHNPQLPQYLPANAYNLQNRIPLIINELHKNHKKHRQQTGKTRNEQ